MPKSRMSSVWQHFDINQECENFAVCRYCHNNISRGGKSSNVKGNNTTNLWTHLRHKHGDEVIILSKIGPIGAGNGNSRVTKVKKDRTVRLAQPKVLESQANELGALPPKWEQYDQTVEISEDIKNIIYSEDPLCYSPIGQDDNDEADEAVDKPTVFDATQMIVASPVPGSAVSIASSTKAVAPMSSKATKHQLDSSIDRLSTSIDRLVQFEEQNKDDDYYFALSLVPIMRQLSLSRKLFVRSKIQEILFKESEKPLTKSE